jgi:putative ATP-binding cassette transporter
MAAARARDGAKGDAAHIEGKPARFVPTLMRALRLARIYYDGDQRGRARGLLLVMLALCAATTGLMVVFSYVQRDMSTALSGKDVPGFYAAVNRYLLVIVIAAPLFAVYQYVQSLVALEWRLWLTRLLLRKYFANHAYFALKAEGTTDNPDQRICDDVRNFVDSCTSVLLAVAQKTLSMGAFFGVLWGISPNLVAFCFLYSLFGTVVTTRVFGAKLMGLHFLALRREADLRFQLVRAREHAESVALYRGAARELAAARAKLADAARTLLRKIEWGRNLALFTNAYEFATFALPSLIIAPRYFAGEVEFGVVTQAGYAFRTVQGALNIVVGRFEQLSGLAAETERLERLLTMLDAIEDGASASAGAGAGAATSGKGHRAEEIALRLAAGTNPSSSIRRGVPRDGATLRLERVSVRTPLSRRELWRDLTLELREGDAALVVGPSGCGKSSLLRAVAGVWSEGTGEIAAPPPDEALFLPQAPYMPLGSLRAQVLFPDAAGESEDDADPSASSLASASPAFRRRFDDDDILAALDACGLGDLVGRFADRGGLDAREEWSDVLSAGEQQRVAFARLYLRRPSCAFLDEATSALDETSEAAMYDMARLRARTIVSVGHRGTLLRHHTRVLRFVAGAGGGAGAWVSESIEGRASRGGGEGVMG